MSETNPAATLATLERETGPNPVGTLIWLHGLGADASDFEPLVPMLELPVASGSGERG